MLGDWRFPASKPHRSLLRQAISFHPLTKRGWKQNWTQSKGRAELKSLTLPFFGHETGTKLFFFDQPEDETFQSLLPENILLLATLFSLFTIVMRMSILQFMKSILSYDFIRPQSNIGHQVFLLLFDRQDI